MVTMSNRQQPHQDEKYQFKATKGSTMNNKEILTPQGRLQLALKQHYTQLTKWLP